ncbi:YibE/F family protein [Bengtsoniella intestinalis]|uniref:YibE/F family protein n=1 Tax=Bengtsoniella intestinalis TaxID=3073143 RepID=UPI00391EF263
MKEFFKRNAAVIVSAILLLILIAMPTGYEDAVIYEGRERCRAEVLEVYNDNITTIGIVSTGDQTCLVELQNGAYAGTVMTAYNMLSGSVETDKIFAVGDEAYVLVSHNGEEVTMISMVDHYRLDVETVLIVLFFAFLILVAGKTGVRAILSFVITILMIWKVLIPNCLNGINPIVIGFVITAVLTVVIISLVFGYDKMALSAISGSLIGTFVTMVMALMFTDLFHMNGSILDGSAALLYNGYPNLDLKSLFIASIFIGSSGAVMDLAVDITSAVNEVVDKKPDITALEAIKSGMNVGRAAMGTMTTTLLLAYSGGYLSLLMVFMAQGTPIDNLLNYKYVSSEILDTVVGSFGLVSVAPITAICAGVLLTKKPPQ